MDPVDFYRLGLRLISGSSAPDAAACRTAIGRAYFAAVNRAEEVLARWGASCGKGPQKHGLAVRLLHATDDPDLKLASADLDRLRSLRNRADYEMGDAAIEKPSWAKTALDLSKNVFDSLEHVENNPARSASAEGRIRAYQQRTNTP